MSLNFLIDFARMMLLEENQIAFHSDDGLIFDGVKDYTRQLAESIGLGSDSDFLQAGVSLHLIEFFRHVGTDMFLFVSTFGKKKRSIGYLISLFHNYRCKLCLTLAVVLEASGLI